MPRFILVTALVLVAACGSSTGPGGRTNCNPALSIGSDFAEPTGTIDVMYSASVTGDGQISSLTYAGPSGPVMVSNPALPYSITTTVPLPTQATMTASATYTNGTITIAYSASVGGSDDEQGNQVCGGNSG